jgi:hypothetical protein
MVVFISTPGRWESLRNKEQCILNPPAKSFSKQGKGLLPEQDDNKNNDQKPKTTSQEPFSRLIRPKKRIQAVFSETRPRIELLIDGQPVDFLYDTGAISTCIMEAEHLQQFPD